MARAVIFDWYGTLARWQSADVINYAAVLSALGYNAAGDIIDGYFARWDGVDHQEHSTSVEAYAQWTRWRLGQLVTECGVAQADIEQVVEALVASDQAPMVAYPEAVPTLKELRRRGYAIGVCSNWGWELGPFLEATGVALFVDVAVTSARAGFRKPHHGIYELTLRSLGVGAAEAIFVGDSWAPDVLGPSRAGMVAVHVLRDGRRPAPALAAGMHRVSALDHLLALSVFDEL